MKEYGFVRENRFQQLGEGMEVYPDDDFHAVSLMEGTKHITENTYAIHWHTLTWVPKKSHIFRFIRTKLLLPVLGSKNGMKFLLSVREKLGIGEKK